MKEKISLISIISVGILSILILFLVFTKYLLPILLPFIISLMIAASTVNPAKALSQRINAPERIIRLVISVVVTLFFFALVSLLLWRISTGVWGFLTDMNEKNGIYGILSSIPSVDSRMFGKIFPPEILKKIGLAVDELIASVFSALAEWIASIAASLPQIFLFVLVSLVSLIYFALDYDKIASFIKGILPEKATVILRKIRLSIITVIKKYLLSYSIILLITYGIILAGLLILRVKHAPVIAFLISILDLLPVIGVGTVLIPWSIAAFIGKNAYLGIGLIILFLVNTLIRQYSEPKILGKSLDLHPIVTLMIVYIGYALFGFFGMILLPVVVVSLVTVLKGNDSSEIE